MPDFSKITKVAIEAALSAGKILFNGFGTSFKISTKAGKQNYVTEFDHASEAKIISVIKDYYPDHQFLAEESGFINENNKSDIRWIIDPLDGTTNFSRNIPIFTISIAAYQKNRGLTGVIYQPITNELFVAESGKGAFLNDRSIHVSKKEKIDDALFIAGLPYDTIKIPEFNLRKLTHLIHQGAVLRNLGSAALALSYIAAGKADALWMYDLFPWDIAAGQILIDEAGGKLTRYLTNHLEFSSAHILASNQILHPFLINFLENS